MIGRSQSIGAYIVRSRLVYIWAVAATAWLLHALQYALRHSDILFELTLPAATLVLANTAADIGRPILFGALFIAPFTTIGYWLWRR